MSPCYDSNKERTSLRFEVVWREGEEAGSPERRPLCTRCCRKIGQPPTTNDRTISVIAPLKKWAGCDALIFFYERRKRACELPALWSKTLSRLAIGAVGLHRPHCGSIISSISKLLGVTKAPPHEVTGPAPTGRSPAHVAACQAAGLIVL